MLTSFDMYWLGLCITADNKINHYIIYKGNTGMFWGLESVDVVAIVVYFAFTIWIGVRSAKKINNQEDFYLGGRSFGKLVQTFAAFGQGTSSESVVTTTAAANKSGAAGGWLMTAMGVLVLPFLWFIPVIMRRLRLLNMAEFFVDRYQSQLMAAFYSIIQVIFFMLIVSMGFKGMSATISAIAIKPVDQFSAEEMYEYDRAERLIELKRVPIESLGANEVNELLTLNAENPKHEFSYVDSAKLMIVIAVMVLLYAVMGGLEAAFITDLVQGGFIILLTIILVPFAWIKIVQQTGHTPFEAMHTELPTSMLELFGSPHLADFTWYYVLSFSIVGGIALIGQANQMTACGSAKDDTVARIGFFTGIVMKRFSAVVWVFIGLMTVILYGDSIKNPEFIWGHATRDLLGGLGFGLVGLMIASLTAALMSTADTLMLTASSLVTNNVYKLFVTERDEKHYLLVGRIFSVLYIAGAVTIAIFSGGLVELFIYVALFNAVVAASIWMGIIWRRANLIAAWSSMIIAFCLFILLPILLPIFPGVQSSEMLKLETNPIVVQSTYTATKGDKLKRVAEIKYWRLQNMANLAVGQEPIPVEVGKPFSVTTIIPAQPVFWAELSKDVNGEIVGKGLLNVELVALQAMGFDLGDNRNSLNKTIAVSLKLIIPFGILILVGFLTKPQDKHHLDIFYAKLRTPVAPTAVADAKQMHLTTVNPSRFDKDKLFTNSEWEFRRWNKDDWAGIFYSVITMITIVGLLWGMLIIGR
jgi:SSS family solute:Na+ symporter